MSDEMVCDMFTGERGCNLKGKPCHECEAARALIRELERNQRQSGDTSVCPYCDKEHLA